MKAKLTNKETGDVFIARLIEFRDGRAWVDANGQFIAYDTDTFLDEFDISIIERSSAAKSDKNKPAQGPAPVCYVLWELYKGSGGTTYFRILEVYRSRELAMSTLIKLAYGSKTTIDNDRYTIVNGRVEITTGISSSRFIEGSPSIKTDSSAR